MATAVHGSERSADNRASLGWSIHFYKHEGELLLDGTLRDVSPGSVGVVPPAEIPVRAFSPVTSGPSRAPPLA